MRPIDADALYDFLTQQIDAETSVYINGRNMGISIACAVLRNKEIAPTIALPPNDPLTLEELREMDGEPVWNDTMKKWMLVDLTWEYGERTVDAAGKWRGLDDRYYRRKPEGGTQ